MPEDPIKTIGTISSAYNDRAFRVLLKNGKEVLGHPAKSFSEAHAPLSKTLLPETKVHLELTPYDFEKARIVALA